MATKTPVLFLDRDGVLNIPEFRDGRSYAPRDLKDFRLYPDVYEAINMAKKLGYYIAVVTNQPDINNKFLAQDMLDRMHDILLEELPIDRIEVCPHTQADNCSCRKPMPGMLENIAKDLNVDTLRSFVIGDRASDIEAGIRAGYRTIFIDHSYESEEAPTSQDYSCFSLLEAITWVARQT